MSTLTTTQRLNLVNAAADLFDQHLATYTAAQQREAVDLIHGFLTGVRATDTPPSGPAPAPPPFDPMRCGVTP